MKESRGRIVALLAEPSETLPPGLADLINKNIKPPTPVTADQVYVRAMYIASDEVNSFGGRFPIDEHERLVELLMDSPVLIGHRKDKLPVGRNFHAVSTERDGCPWVKSYFYWLRTAEGAEDLRENIDGGIYKECSIAFTFAFPECSICGRDIRECEHEPLQSYQVGGAQQECYFNYRQLQKVLETSLVYRGAVPNTSVSKELDSENGSDEPRSPDIPYLQPVPLDNFDSLDRSKHYAVVPKYEGLSLTATVTQGKLLFARLDGTPIDTGVLTSRMPDTFAPAKPVAGVLVGYRGKDRCSADQITRHLDGRSSLVSRLVFNVLPCQEQGDIVTSRKRSAFDVRTIPHRIAIASDLRQRVREIMTRDGVEIWSLDSDGKLNLIDERRYTYHPDENKHRPRNSYRLLLNAETTTAHLIIEQSTDAGQTPVHAFEIAQFDFAKLRLGGKFIATMLSESSVPTQADLPANHSIRKGIVQSFERSKNAFIMNLAGCLDGRFVMRPIKINGRLMHLFYHVSGEKAK
ncbi:MAG: hypothetical protein DRP45_02090 [Candidatus Zixiibacteriota bacterium]|nr:MAG: hypothetical protein DRP45_02090 [candidate division Zixibacteria bacterium]